jgi:hypothetical protein
MPNSHRACSTAAQQSDLQANKQQQQQQQLTKQDGAQGSHNKGNSVGSPKGQLLCILVSSREEVGANILAQLTVHCMQQRQDE